MGGILDKVKQRLGIAYSDPIKDAEITQMIAGAKAVMISGGWGIDELVINEESPEAVEAIVIWCKQAQNLDSAEMDINPIFRALVANARAREIARKK